MSRVVDVFALGGLLVLCGTVSALLTTIDALERLRGRP